MPTYQCQCNACDHSFEEHQSITAKAFVTCPECGANALEKLISGGSGYFVKDSGVLPDAKPTPKDHSPKKEPPKHDHGDHGHGHGHHHHCHHH